MNRQVPKGKKRRKSWGQRKASVYEIAKRLRVRVIR